MGELVNLFEYLSLLESVDVEQMQFVAIPPEAQDSDEEAMEVEEVEVGDEEESVDEEPAATVVVKVVPAQDPDTLAAYSKSREWTLERDLPQFPQYSEYPSNSLDPEIDPVNVFELFFDEEVWDHLLQETNSYGGSDIELSELKVFVGILLLSGYLDVPRWRLYWEVGTETFNEYVSNAMRRNRFEDLKKSFHLADNNCLDRDNKFSKAQPFFDLLNDRYCAYAPLVEHLSIDESICPFFGRHSAKQFIRGKPIQLGFKYWCLNTPSGYLINFFPYQGAGEERDAALGLGGSVVKKLCSVLPNDNHFTIYGERFFSSIKLAYELKRLGIGYTGTVNASRTEKCPLSDVAKQPRGYCEYQMDESSGVLVLAWNDNRPVIMLTTIDDLDPMHSVSRWSAKEKKRIQIEQPNTVACTWVVWTEWTKISITIGFPLARRSGGGRASALE